MTNSNQQQRPESNTDYPVFAFPKGGVSGSFAGTAPFPFFYTPKTPHQFRIIWHNPFDYYAKADGIQMGVAK